MVWQALAFGLAVALMFVGLLGVFVPAIPGVGFMWVVVLVYALVERFATIDPYTFAALTVLGLAGATSDLWMSQLGARVSGASFRSTLASLVGLFVAGLGLFLGMIVGSVLGVLLNEYRERRAWGAAWRATIGLAVGLTLSTVVEFCVGLAMLALFVWQALRG
jgi:uncharacterized protein YqgC (DUF456 family)